MPTGVCPGFSPQGREDEIRDLLLTITTADVLDDDKSPQAKAIEWLIEEDALEVCPEAQAQIIQRFGLAAFYYSTEGDKWNFCGQEKNDCQGGERFLSSASECDWYGVRCNGGGKVNELKLEPCKYYTMSEMFKKEYLIKSKKLFPSPYAHSQRRRHWFEGRNRARNFLHS
jgi:hypothetical protein